MFAQILIAEAHAQATTTGAGSTVDLQWFIMTIVGGIVMGVGTLLYKKAPANGEKKPPENDIQHAQVFFQGPFQKLLDKLDASTLLLERVAGQHAELREAFAELLRGTRHDLKGVLQIMSQDIERDSEEIKEILRRVENALARLDRIEGVLGRLDEFVRARVK